MKGLELKFWAKQMDLIWMIFQSLYGGFKARYLLVVLLKAMASEQFFPSAKFYKDVVIKQYWLLWVCIFTLW